MEKMSDSNQGQEAHRNSQAAWEFMVGGMSAIHIEVRRHTATHILNENS
jgi:hypothetical protein